MGKGCQGVVTAVFANVRPGQTVSNGQEIVFEFAEEAGDPSQLWLIGIDGSDLRPLGIQGESPDWKPGTGIDFTERLLPLITDR